MDLNRREPTRRWIAFVLHLWCSDTTPHVSSANSFRLAQPHHAEAGERRAVGFDASTAERLSRISTTRKASAVFLKRFPTGGRRDPSRQYGTYIESAQLRITKFWRIDGQASIWGFQMLREFAGLLKRLSAVAGVVSLFAFAGQANAVSYVGKWDPQLPDPFSSYRWEGSVLFSLPCLSAGNTFTGTKNGANCSGLSLTSGTVQFFDTHGTLTLGDDTLVETLNFNPVALSFLTSVTLLNGTPTGVVGDFKTYLQSSIFADGVDSNNGTATEWDLSFNGLPVLKWKYQVCEVDDDACHFAVAVREFEECETIKGSTPTRGPGAPTWTSFATVPEPGSLALLLPALSALAFVRRRKNSTEGGALV